MSFSTWFKNLIAEIKADIMPGIEKIESGLPAIAVAVGQALLAGVEVGTPYAAIGATLVQVLESQGVKLASGAAQAVLNEAENNLIKAGTPAPITVASTAAIAAATPLPVDNAAVVAATAIIPAEIAAAPADGATDDTGKGTN